jgi:LAO/AO transport system kinase
MADGILITKAEEENELLAKKAKQYLGNVLGLFHPKASEWEPKIDVVSSYTGKNIDLIPMWLDEYKQRTMANGYFETNRNKQNVTLFEDALNHTLKNFLLQQPKHQTVYQKLREEVTQGQISPYAAVHQLLSKLFPDSTSI